MSALAGPRPGRNDACHCGSGKKYKHCCLAKDDAEARAARAAAQAETPAAAAEPAAPAPGKRPPKPQTQQPWRATTSRGFAPRSRMPRKAGGS
ncbi:MAG: SEC-C metal-binding domain-containing protein [Vicinamibacterales bacterium]